MSSGKHDRRCQYLSDRLLLPDGSWVPADVPVPRRLHDDWPRRRADMFSDSVANSDAFGWFVPLDDADRVTISHGDANGVGDVVVIKDGDYE